MGDYYDNVVDGLATIEHDRIVRKVRGSKLSTLIKNGLTVNELFSLIKMNDGLENLLSDERKRSLVGEQ